MSLIQSLRVKAYLFVLPPSRKPFLSVTFIGVSVIVMLPSNPSLYTTSVNILYSTLVIYGFKLNDKRNLSQAFLSSTYSSKRFIVFDKFVPGKEELFCSRFKFNDCSSFDSPSCLTLFNKILVSTIQQLLTHINSNYDILCLLYIAYGSVDLHRNESLCQMLFHLRVSFPSCLYYVHYFLSAY